MQGLALPVVFAIEHRCHAESGAGSRAVHQANAARLASALWSEYAVHRDNKYAEELCLLVEDAVGLGQGGRAAGRTAAALTVRNCTGPQSLIMLIKRQGQHLG